MKGVFVHTDVKKRGEAFLFYDGEDFLEDILDVLPAFGGGIGK